MTGLRVITALSTTTFRPSRALCVSSPVQVPRAWSMCGRRVAA